METGLIEAISTVGFPIVAVIACAWFIYVLCMRNQDTLKKEMQDIRTASEKREERLYNQIDKFSDTLNRFSVTLDSIDNRLARIENKEDKD